MRKASAKKCTLKAAHADDDDIDDTLLPARVVSTSADGRRYLTSIPVPCARINQGQNSALIDLTALLSQPPPKPYKHRYANSDKNMIQWVTDGRPQEFLYEMVRLEGRGDTAGSACGSCGSMEEVVYGCKDCWGTTLECCECVLKNHRRLPFHRLKFWNGQFFERQTLQQLGLRVQFGHGDGGPCSNPIPVKDFTIIHEHGLSKINADFCGCSRSVPRRIQLLRAEIFPSTTRYPKTGTTFRTLETYEKLGASGKCSIYEYYNALTKMTDALAIDIPKTRYKSMLRMNQQYGHLKMMKRGGRGAIPDGISTTKPGELAIPCPACPRVDVNLPADWKSAKEDSFLYMLILALDANFRLSNLRRLSSADPGLHTGLAYFCPPAEYITWVMQHPRQNDISTCSGFKTLAHTESKNSAGLQSTGVGMCVCARHEMIRPLGVGDLQRGERYCNMDWIATSGAKDTGLQRIFYSYDIVCQWSVSFLKRMQTLPAAQRLSPDITLGYGVPKCHCRGHHLHCQCQFSMHVQPGVGRTDGEGIERTWSGLNHAASSTKEMLPGSRHDILDRRMSAHNWEKTTGMAGSLHQREANALWEYNIQSAIHQDFTEILPAEDIERWTKQVVEWEAQQSLPNPYFLPILHESESKILYTMKEKERQDARTTTPLHDTSASAFIALGLLIEDTQRQISQLLVCDDRNTPGIVKDVQEKRTVLQRHLDQYRSQQRVYMPCVSARLAELSGSREGDIEGERIFLPSELDEVSRQTGCLGNVAEKEERLREAQCFDSLETLRTVIRSRRSISYYRQLNQRSQKQTTRTWSTLHRLKAREQLVVQKYRTARNALLLLRGPGVWIKTLRMLDDKDIRDLNSQVFDIDDAADMPARKKMRLGQNKDRAEYGSSTFELSWIWMVGGAMDSMAKDEMDGMVRIEWLKSRARVNRSWEDVRLLREEKRRTLLSFRHEATAWQGRTSGWAGLDDTALLEGISAYGQRQADNYETLAANCESVWSKVIKAKKARVKDRIDLKEDGEQDEEQEQEEQEPEAQEAVEGEGEGEAAPVDSGAASLDQPRSDAQQVHAAVADGDAGSSD